MKHNDTVCKEAKTSVLFLPSPPAYFMYKGISFNHRECVQDHQVLGPDYIVMTYLGPSIISTAICR